MASTNSFNAHGELTVGEQSYEIYRIDTVEGHETLPYSLKVLLENLLRTEDGANITADHINAIGQWDENAEPDTEIQFTPARVIAGLHRRALHRRPGHHARGRGRPRWGCLQDQPACPG